MTEYITPKHIIIYSLVISKGTIIETVFFPINI